MIEVIEKLLFIHESQIRRWGRMMGLFSIYSGLIFLLLVPIFDFFLNEWFSGVRENVVSFYEGCDIKSFCFVKELMELTQDSYLLIGNGFLIVAGFSCVSYGLLMLKFHKYLTALE